MKIIKPPQQFFIPYPSVFLAGSIEMGKAVDWQVEITNALTDTETVILNPRRDDWDSSWEQKIENNQFREQVEWELKALELSTIIAMYFDPKTMSPISLLELGLYARSNKLILCCPDGFWRKGNVDVVCKKYHIEQTTNLESLIYRVKERLGRWA